MKFSKNQLVRSATFSPISGFINYKSSVSRGINTYGYNIVRLTDNVSGNNYRTTGGGYDMLGTCLGMYLEDVIKNYGSAKIALSKALKAYIKKYEKLPYGLSIYDTKDVKLKNKKGDIVKSKILTLLNKGSFSLDGGCGENSMVHIAELMGINIKSEYIRSTRKGKYDQFLGYRVSVEPTGLFNKELIKEQAGE